ncbi:MAG: 1L-myo-inositol 1-phosphate cytidylyltransferase / CDP-L-myo-inositol myo-inositolphosphotransferase [Verrucomicrobiota bacterium]|jgi:phosphatidylglycerophosphate synthase
MNALSTRSRLPEPITYQVVVLADESADWKIAGLSQLTRLAFALDEFLQNERANASATVVVRSKIDISSMQPSPTLPRIAFAPDLSSPPDLILSTRLFFFRDGVKEFCERQARVLTKDVDLADSKFDELDRFVRDIGSSPNKWQYIENQKQIPPIEIAFLSAAGKSQDGLVAKYINRPISRRITRVLLHFPITPNQWTVATSLLALPACFLLADGSYSGIVAGAVCYQVINILDGCDGEISRAKYLESERGRRFDAFCDLVLNLIFVLSLGIGLFRREQTEVRWVYLSEAVLSVSMVAVRLARYARDLLSDATTKLSPQHETVIRTSGARFFGSGFTDWLFQMAKRDVAFFAFAILAVFGRAPWILHCFFAFALGSLILSWKGRAAGDKIDIAVQ